ncbi:ROK family transcriptional regulator [Novosphingobium flavum]|uniref:ROK family transcriptional regulator n=1 Tax=Novosphingobium flavum TaxID=1778672 RepID=A0A7X1KMU0_9SPHN|nr:ROK family transcriptional regulator [Novosphingobium flavum]MBC2666718.1 ROK family transcriptional regulator [Novosphingobium flavum]
MTKTGNVERQASRRADRATNIQGILDALRANGPCTQAEIARMTSLSPATVNKVVQALRDEGKVEYNWKNRREALVCLSSARDSLVTMLVRSSAVYATLLDFSNQTRIDLASSDLETWREQESSPAMALDIAKRLIAVAQERGSPVSGLAIAIEGPIEASTGEIAPWAWRRLPKWKGISLNQHFSRHLRIPIVIENDANLSALAEWTWGVGRGCNDFLKLTCCEGVGGGFIINGKLYHGGMGLAGEIGHMVVEEGDEICFCGNRGCLSGFASENAILAVLRASNNPKSSLQEVVNSAKQGDAACQRVLYEAGVHLGKALAIVVRVISPSVIAIGGILGAAGDIVLDGLRSSPDITNLRAIGQSPEFLLASIIDDAEILGGMSAILAELNLGVSTLAPWMLEPQPLALAQPAAAIA